MRALLSALRGFVIVVFSVLSSLGAESDGQELRGATHVKTALGSMFAFFWGVCSCLLVFAGRFCFDCGFR